MSGKNWNVILFGLVAWMLMALSIRAEVKVKDVAVKPRWPWNGLVDITYSIECDETDDEGNPKGVYLSFTGFDRDHNVEYAMQSLTGDGASDAVKAGGPYTVTWNMAKDAPNLNAAAFQVKLDAFVEFGPYLVIDLLTGAKRSSKTPPNLHDDKCRTTELWLRRIDPGSFVSKDINNDGVWVEPHDVFITKMFYIGIFECTQKQWEIVGENELSVKTFWLKGDTRPADDVTYFALRGDSDKALHGWPRYGHDVDDNSFMGKLRAKTGLLFDLPTEAQWEYACRAGTQTDFNFGADLTDWNDYYTFEPLNDYCRYSANIFDGKGGYYEHTKVGSYRPNAWGLYDMHGNAWEFVLDWFEDKDPMMTEPEIDPAGPMVDDPKSSRRVVRGGNWESNAADCVSSSRQAYSLYNRRSADTRSDDSGYSPSFRIAFLPFEQLSDANAQELSSDSVLSDLVRVDARSTVGGRILCGTERISPVATKESANARLSIDGAVTNGWTVENPLLDSMAIRMDGWHRFTLDEGANTASIDLLVLNSHDVEIHGGVLEANETWAADKLHVIRHLVQVPEGVTLTVEAGAVVKFCEGTELQIDGAIVADRAVFTTITDDTAGGDTDANGEAAIQCYNFYKITGNGSKTLTDCDIRYSDKVAASMTWKSGDVIHVMGSLSVPAGVTLTIQKGAIIKFATGAELKTDGGSIIAEGGLFTHIADDSEEAGGDTNEDGTATVPVYDAYKLTGFTLSEDCEVRYVTAAYAGGSINNGETMTLGGNRIYKISSDIVVRGGGKLIIQPGAILKMEENTGIFVYSGGTLEAIGTRAQPIVITSLKDDSYGGDTNGDGEDSMPGGGDWNYIDINGTANLAYCTLMYGAPNNESGIVHVGRGSVLEMDSCIVAHAKYDGIWNWGGYVTVRNSIIMGVGMSVASYYGSLKNEYVNCVFYANQFITMYWSNFSMEHLDFKNCVFKNIFSGWISDNGYTGAYDHLTFQNCLFHNDIGYAEQSFPKVGSDGNIWGDPLFTDADNGDFTLKAGSPCIDAGDGTVAPATDYWGRPRMDVLKVADTGTPNEDGICVDIGIYEMQGTYNGACANLTVTAVSAPSDVMSGETVTVRWTITNEGEDKAIGPWRDVIALQSVDEALGGQIVTLGEAVVNETLEPQASVTIERTFQLPPLKTGNWRVGVTTNGYRDVYEVKRADNQSFAEDVTAVALPIWSSTNNQFRINGYSEMGFVLPPSAAARIMTVTLPPAAKMSAYGAGGYLPSAVSSDVKSVTLSDGTVLLYVPANESETYVTLVNEGVASATATVSVEETALSLLEASPLSIFNQGTSTMRIIGTELSADSVFTLTYGATAVTGTTITLEDGLVAVAQFNVDGIDGGRYTLSVEDGGRTASMAGDILVRPAGIGPKLEAWLETPPAVRDGRIYTAWLCYKNSGDVDMTMPIFEVECSATTQISYTVDGEYASRPLRYAGISPTAPAGVLKAGEENRLPIFFSLNASYTIRFTTIAQEEWLSNPTFGTWANYGEAMARAATRLNARGKEEYRGSVIYEEAYSEICGTLKSAISGHLKEKNTGIPLEGVTVHCYGTDDEADSTTVTDADGWFVFDNLSYGTEYELLAASGLQEENLVVATPDTGELTGVVLSIKKLPTVHGWVLTEAEDLPLAGMDVTLYSDGMSEHATTDDEGHFSFENVTAGEYSLQATPAEGYAGEEQTITVTEADSEKAVYLRLEKGSIVYGVVTLEDGDLPLPGVTVLAMCAATGATYTAVTNDDGVYQLSGLPAGRNWLILGGDGYEAIQRYAVDVPEEEITEIEQNITAVKAAPFTALPSQGAAPLTVKIYAMEKDFSSNASDWRWDFDGDGQIDYRGANPSWTYTTPGKYDITVWYVDAEGNEATAVKRGAVEVREPLETIVNDNVIVLTDSTDYDVVAFTENTVTLKQKVANPAKPVSVGSVLLSNPDIEQAFSRKVVSMTRVGDTLELITDQAKFDEIFEQCDLSIVEELSDGDIEPVSETRGGMRAVDPEPGTTLELRLTEVDLQVIPFIEKPVFEFNVRCENKKMKQMHMAMVFPVGLQIKFHDELRARITTKKTKNLFRFNKGWTWFAGPIPVWTTLRFDFNLFFLLDLSGRLTVDLAPKVTLYIKRGFDIYFTENGGIVPISENTIDTDLPPLELKFLDASSIRVSAGIEAVLSLMLYEGLIKMGAGADASLFLKLANSQKHPGRPSFSIGHGLKAYIHASVLYSESEFLRALKIDLSSLSFKRILGSLEVPWMEWFPAMPEFTYSPTKDIKVNTQINFTDKSLKGDESFKVEKWLWDFGDGQTYVATEEQQGPLPYAYADDGCYEVSLKLESEHFGYLGKYTKTIHVGDDDDDDDPPTKPPTKPPKTTKGGVPMNSVDPNEISGMIGLGDSGTQRFVKPGEWLDYTVYFENKSTAAVPAQEVTVTHQLSKWLDWSSLELGEIAFNNQIQLELKGKARGTATVPQNDTNYHVQMTAATDETTGGFTLYLRSYDKTRQAYGYWPESVYAGFLPPNDSTHRGEGHVSFRVKVRDDAPEGAFINAEATIVFDMNEPITTAPAWFNWVTTEENPVADPTTLRWDTSDDEDGTTYVVNYWMGDPDPTAEATTVTFNSDVLTTGSFQLPDGLALGTYYWNVTKTNGDESSKTSTWSFDLLPIHTVTVINGAGSGTYKQQTVVTATATGMDGRIFTGWTAEGIALSDSERYATVLVFVMPDNDVTLTANYDLLEGEIPLLPGWNLVAAPGNLDSKNNALAFSGLQPFVYDAKTKAYMGKSFPLNGGEAMWIYSRSARNVPLAYEDEGSVVGGLTDKRGWQMVGVGGEEDVTLDHVLAAWEWSAGKWKPLEINDGTVLLKAGRGYFIYKE
jgi:formylglycine-generating enzyme required for sulfatase activity